LPPALPLTLHPLVPLRAASSASTRTIGSGSTAGGRRGPKWHQRVKCERKRRMNADLAQLLERFPRARIAAIGDLVADEFVYGETDRISREAPVLIVRYESAELKPGCAANAIANLCALGAQVQAIGLVGGDEIGRRLRQLLREAGADDSTVLVKEDDPTSTKTRVLAGGKNTRRQQMLRIDRDGPREPGPQLTQKLLKALASVRCDAIMVS